MPKIKISIDKEKCMGCGTCFAMSPEIFAPDIDGKAKLVVTETEDPELIEKAKTAKDMCPNGAIVIDEEE
jgi:ferredoxin